jgi:hypothetical protein
MSSFGKIGLSFSTWFLAFAGVLIVRMETHAWVNTVLLTVVFPLFIWLMSKNNIVSSMSQGGMFATVFGAALFMTLLLEGFRSSRFSRDLKKKLKEYGKTPLDTAQASLAIAGSLLVGLGFSYVIQKDQIIGF